MPNVKVLNDGSCVAAADYSAAANQWLFVRLTGDRLVTKGVTTEGDAVYGILQNLPETNQAAEVALLGISQLQVAAPVTAGMRLMSTTGGLGKAATAAKYAGAIAREAGGTNEQVSVFIIPGSPPIPV